MNYDSLPDANFRKQYDVTPKDEEVEALLAGVEPPKQHIASRETTPRVQIIEPKPQFKWLKPLGPPIS